MIEIFKERRLYSYSQARCHERYPAQFPVLVKCGEYRLFDEVRDVSEGGIGVATLHPMPPMSLVKVRLEAPHEREPIEVMGRVMWSKPGAMGIRFEQSDVRLFGAVDRIAKDLQRI
ncbi:MAG: PilZ domain [Myxococcaceae bacterium]|nr:PilZ domain [Myxococcaceae bacterium]